MKLMVLEKLVLFKNNIEINIKIFSPNAFRLAYNLKLIQILSSEEIVILECS